MNAEQTVEALKQLANSPVLVGDLHSITRIDLVRFDALRCQVQMGLGRVGGKARFLFSGTDSNQMEMYGFIVALDYTEMVLSFVACDKDYDHESIMLPPIKVKIVSELPAADRQIGSGPFAEPVYVYNVTLT